MKKVLLALLLAVGVTATAQEKGFKDNLVVNGVSYTAVENTMSFVRYEQVDHLDFSLAAEEFTIEVMTLDQWDVKTDELVSQGAVFKNGMFHTITGEQVMVSDNRDKHTGNLLIVTLYGSEDK